MSGPATASGNIAASQPETAEEDSAEKLRKEFNAAFAEVIQLQAIRAPDKQSSKLKSSRQSDGSMFRGVTRHRRTKRWEAHIWQDRRQVYLGGFPEEEQAARAHDVMALRCRGPNTTLNFLLATYNGIAAVLTRIEPDQLVQVLRDFSRETERFILAHPLQQPPAPQGLLPASVPAGTGSTSVAPVAFDTLALSPAFVALAALTMKPGGGSGSQQQVTSEPPSSMGASMGPSSVSLVAPTGSTPGGVPPLAPVALGEALPLAVGTTGRQGKSRKPPRGGGRAAHGSDAGGAAGWTGAISTGAAATITSKTVAGSEPAAVDGDQQQLGPSRMTQGGPSRLDSLTTDASLPSASTGGKTYRKRKAGSQAATGGGGGGGGGAETTAGRAQSRLQSAASVEEAAGVLMEVSRSPNMGARARSALQRDHEEGQGPDGLGHADSSAGAQAQPPPAKLPRKVPTGAAKRKRKYPPSEPPPAAASTGAGPTSGSAPRVPALPAPSMRGASTSAGVFTASEAVSQEPGGAGAPAGPVPSKRRKRSASPAVPPAEQAPPQQLPPPPSEGEPRVWRAVSNWAQATAPYGMGSGLYHSMAQAAEQAAVAQRQQQLQDTHTQSPQQQQVQHPPMMPYYYQQPFQLHPTMPGFLLLANPHGAVPGAQDPAPGWAWYPTGSTSPGAHATAALGAAQAQALQAGAAYGLGQAWAQQTAPTQQQQRAALQALQAQHQLLQGLVQQQQLFGLSHAWPPTDGHSNPPLDTSPASAGRLPQQFPSPQAHDASDSISPDAGMRPSRPGAADAGVQQAAATLMDPTKPAPAHTSSAPLPRTSAGGAAVAAPTRGSVRAESAPPAPLQGPDGAQQQVQPADEQLPPGLSAGGRPAAHPSIAVVGTGGPGRDSQAASTVGMHRAGEATPAPMNPTPGAASATGYMSSQQTGYTVIKQERPSGMTAVETGFAMPYHASQAPSTSQGGAGAGAYLQHRQRHSTAPSTAYAGFRGFSEDDSPTPAPHTTTGRTALQHTSVPAPGSDTGATARAGATQGSGSQLGSTPGGTPMPASAPAAGASPSSLAPLSPFLFSPLGWQGVYTAARGGALPATLFTPGPMPSQPLLATPGPSAQAAPAVGQPTTQHPSAQAQQTVNRAGSLQQGPQQVEDQDGNKEAVAALAADSQQQGQRPGASSNGRIVDSLLPASAAAETVHTGQPIAASAADDSQHKSATAAMPPPKQPSGVDRQQVNAGSTASQAEAGELSRQGEQGEWQASPARGRLAKPPLAGGAPASGRPPAVGIPHAASFFPALFSPGSPGPLPFLLVPSPLGGSPADHLRALMYRAQEQQRQQLASSVQVKEEEVQDEAGRSTGAVLQHASASAHANDQAPPTDEAAGAAVPGAQQQQLGHQVPMLADQGGVQKQEQLLQPPAAAAASRGAGAGQQGRDGYPHESNTATAVGDAPSSSDKGVRPDMWDYSGGSGGGEGAVHPPQPSHLHDLASARRQLMFAEADVPPPHPSAAAPEHTQHMYSSWPAHGQAGGPAAAQYWSLAWGSQGGLPQPGHVPPSFHLPGTVGLSSDAYAQRPQDAAALQSSQGAGHEQPQGERWAHHIKEEPAGDMGGLNGPVQMLQQNGTRPHAGLPPVQAGQQQHLALAAGPPAVGACARVTAPGAPLEGDKLHEYTSRMPSFSSWGTALANIAAASASGPPSSHAGTSLPPSFGAAPAVHRAQLLQPYPAASPAGVTRTVTLAMGLGPGAVKATSSGLHREQGKSGLHNHPQQPVDLSQHHSRPHDQSRGPQQWLQQAQQQEVQGAPINTTEGSQQAGISDHAGGAERLRSQLLARLCEALGQQ